jgi:hypothetical protein
MGPSSPTGAGQGEPPGRIKATTALRMRWIAGSFSFPTDLTIRLLLAVNSFPGGRNWRF